MHREIKVGLFFIVVVAMVFGGIQFLKGRGVLHIDQEFIVYYNNVRGLAPSDDVVVNGLVVGKVSSLELDKKNDEKCSGLYSGDICVNDCVSSHLFYRKL